MDIFNESRSLREIIEGKGWQLYDTTNPSAHHCFTWEELQKKIPATEFVIGNNYFFVPIPKKGESLKEAYSVTKGLGPSIRIDSLEEHINMDGEGGVMINNKITYLFTRLFVDDDIIGLSSPVSAQMPRPPVLAIPFKYVIEKFKKYYTIITPEEL